MYETGLRAVDNYEVKLRLGANGRLTEREIRQRVDRYCVAAVEEERVKTMVRQMLCSRGVAVMMFPYYHAFARELGKLSRQEGSLAAQRERLAVLAAKWVARGLDQAALLEIAATIFNLVLPDPPAPVKGT